MKFEIYWALRIGIVILWTQWTHPVWVVGSFTCQAVDSMFLFIFFVLFVSRKNICLGLRVGEMPFCFLVILVYTIF